MKQSIRLTESDIEKMVVEAIKETRLDEDLTRNQVRDEIEDYAKSRDFDKRVHNIVVDVFNDLIQNMWTKKSFWTTMLRKR
jgi:predicted esterase YcpF (UPF0227 family)